MARGFLLLLITALAVGLAWAGTPALAPVYGRVYDATTKRPLPGVRVVSRQPGEPARKHDPCCPDEAVTDSTGFYSVVPYNSTVAFSCPGYATLSLAWSALRPFKKGGESGRPMLQDVFMKHGP